MRGHVEPLRTVLSRFQVMEILSVINNRIDYTFLPEAMLEDSQERNVGTPLFIRNILRTH